MSAHNCAHLGQRLDHTDGQLPVRFCFSGHSKDDVHIGQQAVAEHNVAGAMDVVHGVAAVHSLQDALTSRLSADGDVPVAGQSLDQPHCLVGHRLWSHLRRERAEIDSLPAHDRSHLDQECLHGGQVDLAPVRGTIREGVGCNETHEWNAMTPSNTRPFGDRLCTAMARLAAVEERGLAEAAGERAPACDPDRAKPTVQRCKGWVVVQRDDRGRTPGSNQLTIAKEGQPFHLRVVATIDEVPEKGGERVFGFAHHHYVESHPQCSLGGSTRVWATGHPEHRAMALRRERPELTHQVRHVPRYRSAKREGDDHAFVLVQAFLQPDVQAGVISEEEQR